MDNKKSDLTNPVFAQNARAEDSSERSSLLEEMKNGIDLQPLEDMEKSEIIAFDDKSGIDEKDRSEISKDKNQIIKKRFLRIIIAVVAVVAIVFGGYTAFLRLDDYSHAAAAVYQKGSSYFVSLDNDKKIELTGIIKAQLSSDGSVMIYSQDTSSKTGKYDIRMLELKKRSSVKNGGSLIVSGIESEWSANNDCTYIYYTETKGKDTHYYAYSVASREIYNITYDASQVFLPPKGDVVYFVRDDSGKQQLYRIRLGERAENIDSVSAVKSFCDDRTMEVFYTVSSGDETYDLYKVVKDESPVKIAENISEVYLDDYSVGGNLYYFIKSASKLNWTDFVTDDYADSDAVLSKPDKGEFLETRGFFLKRTVVNEDSYNAAMEKYNKKLLRDEIRAELDSIDLGVAISSEYKIKVFDGEKSKELAGGVKLENIAGFAKSGTPAVVYKKTKIDSSKKISMDELYQKAVSSGAQESADYVLNAIRGDYDISTGYKYSWFNGTNVFEFDLRPNYDPSQATFLFAGRSGFYTAVKTENEIYSNLYYTSVGDQALAQEKEAAQGVVSFEQINNSLYVLTAQGDEHNSLYLFGPDGSYNKITDNCVQYFADEKSQNVVALTADAQQESLSTVTALVYTDGETEVIDSGIDYRFFTVKGERFAYLTEFADSAATETDVAKGGEMKIYNGEKIKEIDSGVTAIVDFN